MDIVQELFIHRTDLNMTIHVDRYIVYLHFHVKYTIINIVVRTVTCTVYSQSLSCSVPPVYKDHFQTDSPGSPYVFSMLLNLYIKTTCLMQSVTALFRSLCLHIYSYTLCIKTTTCTILYMYEFLANHSTTTESAYSVNISKFITGNDRSD